MASTTSESSLIPLDDDDDILTALELECRLEIHGNATNVTVSDRIMLFNHLTKHHEFINIHLILTYTTNGVCFSQFFKRKTERNF